MQEAGRHFRDYGVFFTDETQDTNAWWGIIENNLEKSWQFELGIIFSKLQGTLSTTSIRIFHERTKRRIMVGKKICVGRTTLDIKAA